MNLPYLSGTEKEVKELPDMLQDDEELLFVTSGLYKGNTWLIVSTNERVIFLDKGMVFGLNCVEILLNKISSVSYETGILFDSIEISDGSSQVTKIEYCDKSSIKPFIDSINSARKGIFEVQSCVSQKMPKMSKKEEIVAWGIFASIILIIILIIKG